MKARQNKRNIHMWLGRKYDIVPKLIFRRFFNSVWRRFLCRVLSSLSYKTDYAFVAETNVAHFAI